MASAPRTFTAAEKRRAQGIYRELGRMYPGARIALRYGNNIQLLAAVILSAQCTDKKVNEVTVELFRKYKTVDDFASAKIVTFQKEIRQTGFYRQKAKNIIVSARMIRDEYGGKVPKTMEELVTLPGVARKTANIVLCNAFNVIEGVAVDTHVKRLSGRFGFTKETNPNKIEQDLMALFPKSQWCKLTYRLIDHGRAICKAPTCKNPMQCFHKIP